MLTPEQKFKILNDSPEMESMLDILYQMKIDGIDVSTALKNHYSLFPSLCLDFYQLTTVAAHFYHNTHQTKVIFEYFIRQTPFNKNSFAISGGLEELVDYLQKLKFHDFQIDYLRSLNRFSESFLNYLKNFRFTGSLKALKEGTLTGPECRGVIFEGTIFEAHIIESKLLNGHNSDTLWNTLAFLLCHLAKDYDVPLDGFDQALEKLRNEIPKNEVKVWEGGLRRAQGIGASIRASRAGYLNGMSGTSNVEAGRRFGIPVIGTHPHAWVMFWKTQLESFLKYYEAHPDNTTFLLDTYDTVESGVPDAIEVAKIMELHGKQAKGGRIDSGNLAQLSIESKKLFLKEKQHGMRITASDGLNRKGIYEIKKNGGMVDDYLVGTNFVTSQEQPALGGVFKLIAIQMEDGSWLNKIKLSNNPDKMLIVGIKDMKRIINNETNKHEADYLCLKDEVIDTNKPLTLINRITKETKTITNYRVEDLLIDIFANGQLVYQLPSLEEIRSYIQEQKQLLSEKQLNPFDPSTYFVALSDKLKQLCLDMQEQERHKFK